MNKVFYILMCMLTLMQSVCSAGCIYSGCVLGGSYYVAPVSYSDIVFEFNCDSDTSGVSPTLGSGTITIDAGVLLNTTDKTEGTGCLDVNNSSYTKFSFDVSGNFDYTNSRIGFWINAQESTSDGHYIMCTANSETAANGFVMKTFNNTSYTLAYLGAGSVGYGSFLATSEWHYIELKFSASAMELFIDGVSQGSRAAGAGSFTDTTIYVGALVGAYDALYDQIRISNDNTRDLYAIRNTVIN